MQTEPLEIIPLIEFTLTETAITLVLTERQHFAIATEAMTTELVRLSVEIIIPKTNHTTLQLEQETTLTNQQERIPHLKERIPLAITHLEMKTIALLLQDQTLLPAAEVADRQAEVAEEAECKRHHYFFTIS